MIGTASDFSAIQGIEQSADNQLDSDLFRGSIVDQLTLCNGDYGDHLPGPIHQQWVATLDAIRDPIFVIDGSSRLVRMNKAFSELAGAGFSELLQRPVASVLPWLSRGNGVRFDRLQMTPDGRMFKLRCFPLENTATNDIVIMEDVTSQKALEMAEEKHQEDTTQALVETLQTLFTALRIKDPYTAAHSKNVAMLSRHIAKRVGYDDLQAQGIYFGATVHDLGKLYVPSGILNRPGKLAQAEFNLIRMHPETGFNIMKNLAFPWPVHDIILQHHERMNGSGYPAGLKGDQISFAARIVAVADVVEAISSHRPYRPALGIDVAFDEIRSNRDVLYDPTVVDACIAIFNDTSIKIFEDRPDADANDL